MAFLRNNAHSDSRKNPQPATEPQYAELHCISNFSFLRGASHPEELIQQAALLGYHSIALTDECSLCGVVRAHQEVKLLKERLRKETLLEEKLAEEKPEEETSHQLTLIIGSEFVLQEGLRVVLIAPHRQAYGELSHLISRSRRNAVKGQYVTSIKDLLRFIKHCFLIVVFDSENPQWAAPALEKQGRDLINHFPSRSWLGITLLKQGLDSLRLSQGMALAATLNIPPLACGNVHMHTKQQKIYRTH